MFEIASFLEVAIPALATGAGGAYILARRRQVPTIRGRGGDLFAAGLLAVAGGAALAAYGTAAEVPGLASAGRLAAALGAIPAVGAAILVLRTYEQERSERG